MRTHYFDINVQHSFFPPWWKFVLSVLAFLILETALIGALVTFNKTYTNSSVVSESRYDSGYSSYLSQNTTGRDVLGITDSPADLQPAPGEGQPSYSPDTVIVKLKDDAKPIQVKQPILPFLGKKPDVDVTDVSYRDLDTKNLSEGVKSIHNKYKIETIGQALKEVDDPYTELTKIRSAFRDELNTNERKLDEKELLEKDLSKLYVLKLTTEGKVEETVAELENDPSVEYVSPDYKVHIDYTPADSQYPKLWSLKNTGQSGGTPGVDLHMEKAWEVTRGSPEVIVAVIDSGIDYTQPELGGCIGPGCVVLDGYDFLSDTNVLIDDIGHGTHVAGTIAARGNASGIIGVCPQCRLLGARFIGENGGYLSGAIDAIQWSVNKGAKVLNNSWGGGGYSQAMQDVISWATAQGAVFVASAGNSDGSYFVNPSDPQYPAAYNDVIAVAATNNQDKKSSYSSYGTWVDVSAPGGDKDNSLTGCKTPWGIGILSTMGTDTAIWKSRPTCGFTEGTSTYSSIVGTSMAAPHVSGLAALIYSKNPSWSAAQVAGQLKYTTDPIDSKNPNHKGLLGTGRINAEKALTTASAQPKFSSSGLAIDRVTERWPNGLIEPGENPDLFFVLVSEWAGARNIQATLTTTHPNVTVIQPSSYYGNMPVGTHKANATAFKIQVSDRLLGNTIPFVLRLAYTDLNGSPGSVDVTIPYTVTSDIGWPKLESNIRAHAGLFTDLNLDGVNELVMTSSYGLKTYTPDGHLIWSWHYKTDVKIPYLSQATTGNVDSDPYPEVVITNWNANGHIVVSVIDHEGNLQKEIPLNGASSSQTPVLVNIDNSDRLEILAAYAGSDLKARVTAFGASGEALWTWTDPVGPNTYMSAVSAGDVNGDGTTEAALTLYMQSAVKSESRIVLLNAQNGSAFRQDILIPNVMIRTPAVFADVDAEGSKDILVTGYSKEQYKNPVSMSIYAFNSNGSGLSGWPVSLGNLGSDASRSYYDYQLTAANLDADAELEIVQVNPISSDGQDKVFAFNHNGTLLPNYPTGIADANGYSVGLIVSNIAGDKTPEILYGTGCTLYGFTGTGSTVSGYPRSIDSCSTAITKLTAGFMDKTNPMKLLVTHDAPSWGAIHYLDLLTTDISYSQANNHWPTYLHDPQSTSDYHWYVDGIQPSPTPTPRPTATPTPTPAVTYTGFTSTLYPTTLALFYFNYSGPTATHHVDVSTLPDMSWNVYIDFGQGSASPVGVTNPSKWTGVYTCGKTLYWRVRQGDFFNPTYLGPIQEAKVSCDTLPTVTPTPTRSPSKTPTPTPVPPSPYTNMNATLRHPNPATFAFTYTGPSALHYIDVSLLPEMAPIVYTSFGQGTSSPVTVTNPTIWTPYACGKTVYWRIRRQGTQAYPPLASAVQKATVTCGPTATPTRTQPTVTPTVYINQRTILHSARIEGDTLVVTYTQNTTVPTYVTDSPSGIIIQGSAGFTGTAPSTTDSRPLNSFLGNLTGGRNIKLCTGTYSVCSNTVTISQVTYTPTPTLSPSPTSTPTPAYTPTPTVYQQVVLHSALINSSQNTLTLQFTQATPVLTYVAAPSQNILIQKSDGFNNSSGTVTRPLSEFQIPLVAGNQIRLCTSNFVVCSNTVNISSGE